MSILTFVFWLAVAIVAYVYVGYPVLLAIWARVAPRPVRRAVGQPPPGVSIVIAARNEGVRLSARLENLLALDYPAGRRQVIVVSDGSTDQTSQVVARFFPDVELVTQPALGKAAALNAGVARARHDILVFADARQRFAPDAVRQLVAAFADPGVGAVSGQLVLDCEGTGPRQGGSTIADGVGLYWRYEKWLRRHESEVGSTLGVSGAVYAMRRSAWRSLPPDTVLDDVLAPMRVVLAGQRVVFEQAAIAYDRGAPDAAAESRRKVRTLAGNYQLLWREPRLMVPFLNPVWLQFVSHKVGRLVVPYALVASFVSSAVLVGHGAVYAAAFVGQVCVSLLAVYGAILESGDHRRAAAGRVQQVMPDEGRPAKRIVNA